MIVWDANGILDFVLLAYGRFFDFPQHVYPVIEAVELVLEQPLSWLSLLQYLNAVFIVVDIVIENIATKRCPNFLALFNMAFRWDMFMVGIVTTALFRIRMILYRLNLDVSAFFILSDNFHL
jgi:hypothetical protein